MKQNRLGTDARTKIPLKRSVLNNDASRRRDALTMNDPSHEKDSAPAADAQSPPVLAPGHNCCAVAEARRAAVLIDAENYFAALDDALRGAERSVMIIGWDFDARIRLRPQDGSHSPTLGDLLRSLVEGRPQLEVRILVWSLAAIHAPGASLPLLLGAEWQKHERIHLHLDAHHPAYASHHQKIAIIDDSLAFVGGMDLTVERWDRPGHAPENHLRRCPAGARYDPVHDVQMVLDGPVVREVCNVTRARWHHATGEALPTDAAVDRWPDAVKPDFMYVPVAVSRTQPRHGEQPAVEEIARLNDDLLRAAQGTVYIEAQYFTGRRLRRLLKDMLAQADGPQIVVVCTRVANGVLERFIMGANRERLLRSLKAVDKHNRLRVYYPVAGGAEERRLLIHSKVMIVDDSFLRIGSANLNNRSIGLDTECDVTVAAQSPEQRESVRRIRDTLLAEHLRVEVSILRAALEHEGNLADAIDDLTHEDCGLRPMTATRGATRSFPGTILLDPERPLPFGEGLHRFLFRKDAQGRRARRDTANSETASVTRPSTRGTTK